MGANYKQMAYILAMNPSNRLRVYRKQAGLSQVELANKVGLSQAAISQLENDTRPLTIDYLRIFSRIFGCHPVDLLADEDVPERLTPSERALISCYRKADPTQQELMHRLSLPARAFKRDVA